MLSLFAWVKPHLTTGKVVISLLIAGCLIALAYSESKGGLDEKMFSPLVMGKGAIFTGETEMAVTTTVSTGSHRMEGRVAKADWHYHWLVTAKEPVTEDVVISELFKQPGISVNEMISRGGPGGIVKTGYKSDADGNGVATWTVKKGQGEGTWEIDLGVHEDLRSSAE